MANCEHVVKTKRLQNETIKFLLNILYISDVDVELIMTG